MNTSMINLSDRLVNDLFNRKNRYLKNLLGYSLRDDALDRLVGEVEMRVGVSIWTPIYVEIKDDIR